MSEHIACVQCGADTWLAPMAPVDDGTYVRRCANGHYILYFPDDREPVLMLTGHSATAGSAPA